MQEVRYLNIKGVNPDHYLNDLVKSIPSSQNPSADVTSIEIDGKNKIRFLEKFFWYHATKDNRCLDNNVLNTPALTTHTMKT